MNETITLYIKSTCPFSKKVLAVVDAYEIPWVEKNIAEDGVYDELESLGGKRQVPFMVDGEIMMYNSDSIVEYLEKRCAERGHTRKKPRVHHAEDGDVCCPA